MSEGMLAYIGLGSNLDSPRQQVEKAFGELADVPGLSVIAQSSLYRSAPIGPEGQPDYINAVMGVNVQFDAESLLTMLQSIEQLHQRKRLVRWGPRTLDLDVLWFAGQSIETDRLTVPHPEMLNRNFVLVPLCEIAPDLLMTDGRSVAEWVLECGGDGLECLAK